MAYSLTDKTVLRSAYGIELRPLQSPRRREPAVVQRPARRADHGHAAAVAGPLHAEPVADHLLPSDADGLSRRAERAGQLQSAQRPRQPHPERSARPATSRAGTSRCSASCRPASTVDVGYVGNKSDHLMILGDLNQARPNANGENTPLQARRPIQGYQFIQAAFDGGKGDYRALQVKVERRYSRGPLPAELVHLVARARQRVRPSRDRQRRQQPRQLREPRRRVRHSRATTSRSTT